MKQIEWIVERYDYYFYKKSNKIVNKYYRNASYSIQGGSINCYVHYSILNVVVFPIFCCFLISYYYMRHWDGQMDVKRRLESDMNWVQREEIKKKKDQISKDCIKRYFI